jgi:hypothetical protein
MSTDTTAGTMNTYANSACTGTPESAIPYASLVNVCWPSTTDDDLATATSWEYTVGTSSAARIMGNLPMITVMVAGLAGLLSMM